MSGAVGGEAMSLSDVLTIANAWPVPSPSSALMFRWSSGHFVDAQRTLDVHVWSLAVSSCTAKRSSVVAWLLHRTPTLPPVASSVEMSSALRLFAFGTGRTNGVTKSVSLATVWVTNTERPPAALAAVHVTQSRPALSRSSTAVSKAPLATVFVVSRVYVPFPAPAPGV